MLDRIKHSACSHGSGLQGASFCRLSVTFLAFELKREENVILKVKAERSLQQVFPLTAGAP